jgi:hypothetical protein
MTDDHVRNGLGSLHLYTMRKLKAIVIRSNKILQEPMKMKTLSQKQNSRDYHLMYLRHHRKNLPIFDFSGIFNACGVAREKILVPPYRKTRSFAGTLQSLSNQ